MTVPEFQRARSAAAKQLREAAILAAARTRARPKPREEPVTNQTCFMPVSTTQFC